MNKEYYILNTTFVTTRSIYPDFVNWLKEVYVPAAMATGLFVSHRTARILTNDEPETVNIACELTCDSISECTRWNENTASLLREDMNGRWGENVLFFCTYLKQLD